MRRSLLALLLWLGLGCLPEPKKREPPPSTEAKDTSLIDTAAIAYAIAGPSASGAVAVARSEMLLRIDCLSCHDELLIAQQRLWTAQWLTINQQMQLWGSQMADKDLEGFSAFLAERYGPENAPLEPARISVSELQERYAPLPDEEFGGGDPVAGKKAFRTYCLDCHGHDARGTSLGVKLFDNPILRRAPDIVKTIRTGRGRMGAVLSVDDNEIKNIIEFLRNLKTE